MPVDPYPGVPSPNTLADASKMRSQLDALYAPVQPAARVKRTTAQSIPYNTLTAVSFTDEQYDNNLIHDPASPTRLTCKTAGVYMIGGSVEWGTGDATGRRFSRLTVNGTVVAQNEAYGGNANVTVPVSALYGLAVNDYVELVVFQDRAGAGALDVLAVNPMTPIFWMHFVSA